MINISYTKLKYTRPTLFENLPSLKTVDLRGNELDHMDALYLSPTFESLYLTGTYLAAFSPKGLYLNSFRQSVELYVQNDVVAHIQGRTGGRPG